MSESYYVPAEAPVVESSVTDPDAAIPTDPDAVTPYEPNHPPLPAQTVRTEDELSDGVITADESGSLVGVPAEMRKEYYPLPGGQPNFAPARKFDRPEPSSGSITLGADGQTIYRNRPIASILKKKPDETDILVPTDRLEAHQHLDMYLDSVGTSDEAKAELEYNNALAKVTPEVPSSEPDVEQPTTFAPTGERPEDEALSEVPLDTTPADEHREDPDQNPNTGGVSETPQGQSPLMG